MSRNNILFATVCALCVVGFVPAAMAVPTLKKLGTTSTSGNRVTTGVAATPRAANTLNASKTSNNLRAPSVRLGTPGVKPVSVNKVDTATKTTNGAADDSRLTIGKYIHTSGVNSGYIKPVVTSSELKAQSDEIVNLIDRVSDLEDNKQDNLVAGNGVEIATNNEISIADNIAGLPDRVNAIEQTLQNLNNQGDTYTKEEINTIVNNVVNNPVIQDDGGDAVSVTLVDDFNDDDWTDVLTLINNE